MHILNPYYFIRKAPWYARILGYKFQVIFRYSVERDGRYFRYAETHHEHRGHYRDESAAKQRQTDLEQTPEWSWERL